MASCIRCLTEMVIPQFECSSCRADFCPQCTEEVVSCMSCSKPLRRFEIPDVRSLRIDIGSD